MTASSPLVKELTRIRNTLFYLKQLGCTGFDCTEAGLSALNQLGFPETSDPFSASGSEALKPMTSPKDRLDRIREDLENCTRCSLHQGRSCLVFGEGDPLARLVFVGEGPGFEEDQTGRPFVGKAGQLLTQIIGAMKLSREKVYIANVVKCRPPENRAPAVDEIRCCLPFLHRQLMAIRPRMICTLGNVAAGALLNTQTPVSRLRGIFQEWNGIPVMPTFHPAFLLRNPEKKRDVWKDMQEIMKKLESGAESEVRPGNDGDLKTGN
ncbi:uracil-DNA glycosylase [Desulfosarcina sp. OttesenSCG-928-A07]|nr:uracil-DNA glycosylase [Desulfosarcina sp. OttesenSCG-928-A07]